MILEIATAISATALLNGWLYLRGWKEKKRLAYVARYKKAVIEETVRFIDPRLRYEAEACIAPAVVDKSGLFPRGWDQYTGDDYVEGQLGRTPIAFSEVHTWCNVADEDDPPEYRTAFQGLFFLCEFNKTFKGRTYVLPDKAEKLLGDVGAALQRGKTQYGELVKLEDPEFERLFAVYGSDQVVSRYVLSTSLMARLTAYQKKTRQNLRIAFVDSHLMLAIPFNRDLFEPRVWRTLIDYDDPRFYFECLQLVAGIVDDLNLNTRIWGELALAHLPSRSDKGQAGAAQPGRQS